MKQLSGQSLVSMGQVVTLFRLFRITQLFHCSGDSFHTAQIPFKYIFDIDQPYWSMEAIRTVFQFVWHGHRVHFCSNSTNNATKTVK